MQFTCHANKQPFKTISLFGITVYVPTIPFYMAITFIHSFVRMFVSSNITKEKEIRLWIFFLLTSNSKLMESLLPPPPPPPPTITQLEQLLMFLFYS